MIKILDENKTHVLQTEKIRGKWWLELVERSTGLSQTVVCDTKKHALTCFKGMSLNEISKWLDNANFDKHKVYKTNYKPIEFKE
jgi:hypothetical protein